MLSLQALFSRFQTKFFWYKGGKLWKDHLKRSVYTVCFATKGPATYRCSMQRCKHAHPRCRAAWFVLSISGSKQVHMRRDLSRSGDVSAFRAGLQKRSRRRQSQSMSGTMCRCCRIRCAPPYHLVPLVHQLSKTIHTWMQSRHWNHAHVWRHSWCAS